jgi:hypothetical protein
VYKDQSDQRLEAFEEKICALKANEQIPDLLAQVKERVDALELLKKHEEEARDLLKVKHAHDQLIARCSELETHLLKVDAKAVENARWISQNDGMIRETQDVITELQSVTDRQAR